jgi:hypothetical protein
LLGATAGAGGSHNSLAISRFLRELLEVWNGWVKLQYLLASPLPCFFLLFRLISKSHTIENIAESLRDSTLTSDSNAAGS